MERTLRSSKHLPVRSVLFISLGKKKTAIGVYFFCSQGGGGDRAQDFEKPIDGLSAGKRGERRGGGEKCLLAVSSRKKEGNEERSVIRMGGGRSSKIQVLRRRNGKEMVETFSQVPKKKRRK